MDKQYAAPAAEIWFVVDTSGSMGGGQRAIEHVRPAIRRALVEAGEVLSDDDDGDHIGYRLVRFSNGAEWLVGRPIPLHSPTSASLESFYLPQLHAGGRTELGKALGLVAAEIEARAPGDTTPLVVVVITDGQPTDDWRRGLVRLGEALTRDEGDGFSFVGVALGADADWEVLRDVAGAFPLTRRAISRVDDPLTLCVSLPAEVRFGLRRALNRPAGVPA